ncbi:hypothetical protein FHX49_001088 [Microbacterium endophyticum]|uniref:HNH nuclease domain-containing protein n=1 Tax=Microbacterium endophyticum TaxID=1526412 RepID=A0A7W4V2A3_9MICO|nr:HNH endonuclease signature motif containing protein [Microbacterium endophyticum]MBB2975522.1 hypothetical protein [Microbacterium endophyticum]NIK35459.1 hypothetical protein [Microbacterium endophyticum]
MSENTTTHHSPGARTRAEVVLSAESRVAQIAQLEAALAADLAEAGRMALAEMRLIASRESREREIPMRSMAAELGAALRMSDRTAQNRIDDAMEITEHYPETFASWSAGRVSERHVQAVLRAGENLTDAAAKAQYDHEVVAVAEVETPGRLRGFAAALAEKAQPRTLQERFDDANATRTVRLFDLADGMSSLNAVLPSVQAHGIFNRLTQQARALKDFRAGRSDYGTREHEQPVDDRRTTDQIRADLFSDMLLTSVPSLDPLAGDDCGGLGAIRAIVQVTVPATTLAGTASTPADLSGLSLVDPESARRLAGAAPGWDRVFTHPVTGTVVSVDRYRPNDQLKRQLRARDQHCRFVGCRMPTHRCDIDHTVDAALGGPTHQHNLAHLCRRHHSLKHASRWTVKQKGDGVLEWTSPTGRSYTDKPPGVAFEPDPVLPEKHPSISDPPVSAVSASASDEVRPPF